LTLDGGESHTNVVTVVGTDDEGTTATANDDHTVDVDNVAPAVSITKDGPATINEGGDSATFEITITNDSVSTDPLTITSLNDDQFGDLLPEAEAANGGPITLDPGDSFSFSFDRELTLDGGESHTNVVTVVGTDDEGTEATANDDHTVGATDVAPAITVDKSADPTQVLAPGEDVTFTVVIENDSVSTDPVTIDSLFDDIHGDLNGQGDCVTPTTIEPGTSYTCSFTVLVDGDETDVVTASGTDDDGTPVSGSDDATVDMINPVINIVKDWNLLVDADNTETVTEGDTIEYTFVVTNGGDVSLPDVTVTDTLPGLSEITFDGGDTDDDGELDVDETWTYSATYVVTAADVLAGVIDNTATASSGETDTSDDSGLVTVPVDDGFQGCVYTQGYWRTHNSKFRESFGGRGKGPASDPTWEDVGGPEALFLESTYTYFDVLWSSTSEEESKWLILARQYIAAELNAFADAKPVDQVVGEPLMQDAMDLLNVVLTGGEWSETEEAEALEIAEVLDLYNNGELEGGPEHCE
jgi:uncharacterized repeat protein (TIGR01451 family)